MKRLTIFFTWVLLIILTACRGDVLPKAAEVAIPATEVVAASDGQISGDDAALSPSVAAPIVPSAVVHTPTVTPQPHISMPLFGVEPHHPSNDVILGRLVDSGSRIIRYGSVLWSDVEPQPGTYHWDALQNMDAALSSLGSQGFEIILVVRGTPEWAQKVPGASCGPVAPEQLGAFANFMFALVQRYSQPPYNVHYWEIGNEPDVDPSVVGGDSGFGCWGDKNDPDYGGGYYAEMLKVVYPTIKSADPSAQVLNGGLLMDCDPTNPPEGADCHSTKFFDGMIRNGAADYLDIVNFHGYPPYTGSLKMDEEYPGWVARGGVVTGKIDYLREVMGRYGVEKPLFLTESSLLCPEWNQRDCLPPDDTFYQAQADYVVRLLVRNWALDIRGTIWYDFEGQGWRYASLLGPDPDNPKPAFDAFRYLNAKLAGLIYTGEVNLAPGVQAYTFENADRQTWVVWSRDETPQQIPLPENLTGIYDRNGNAITPQADGIVVTSPIYIDLLP